MPQEAMDDIKKMDRGLWQVLIAYTKRKAIHYVCNPERPGFKTWTQMISHFDPRTGADRLVGCILANNNSCEPEWTDMHNTQDVTQWQPTPCKHGSR